MEEEKKIKKTAIGNPVMFISQVKQWFKSKSLLQKVLIIFAGIGILLTIYIISVLFRYNGSSNISVGDNTSIQGKVIDQNGEAIEGAVVTGSNNTVVTIPDGTFAIKTAPDDTLTVSAFGYETTHVSASERSVTLSSLDPGTIRLAVVGPENQELSDALVYRLNANSFVPVAIGLTDKLGEIIFQDIPSGQAAFVVLYPDYGFGWLVTSLDPGEVIRPVVRLMPIKGEKKSARAGFKFIKTAYAQAPTSPEFEVRNSLSFQITRDTKIDDKTYYLSEESETILVVGTNKERLKEFVDYVKQNFPDTQGFVMGSETMRAIDRIKEKEGITSPLTTVRITQGPSDTRYQIQYGWQQQGEAVTHIATQVDQRTFTVEIERPTAADAMAFLRAQHAVNTESGQPVVVTSWSKAEAAELAGVQNVLFNQPLATVCCGQSDRSGSENLTVVSEASSNEVLPSNLTLTKPGNKAEYLDYSHNEINEMMGRPNLVTVANGILEQNPNLKFVDETGNEFSFLDVTAPNPNDAPPAFLLDFFENTSDARSKYLDDLTSYQRKWKQFMAAVGSEAFQKEGITPSEFKRSLLKDYGTRSQWRLAEEKRLAQQSGKQGVGQQDANQQSAPANTEDADSMSDELDTSSTEDDGTQPTISESPDSDQDNDQDQVTVPTTPQNSGSGSNSNSNQGGDYNGPQGVQSR